MDSSSKAKRWVDYSRVSKEYLDGVEAFLNFAFENNSIDGKILCPCQKCVLYYHQIRAEAFDHLVINGIMPGYDSWFYRGETTSSLSPSPGVHLEQKNYKSDDMIGMLHDTFGVHNPAADIDMDCGDSTEPNVDDFGIEQPAEQFSSEFEKFKELLRDVDEELYPGCRKFEKFKELEKEIKLMEQHHVEEMKIMKENQARLESEVAMMRSIIIRRFPEETVSDASSFHHDMDVQITHCSSSFHTA